MFKNISPFVLIEPTQEDICLSEYAANPIGPHQSEQVGWVEPVETATGDNLTVMLNEGQEMLCMRIEKRVLPASAVNKKVSRRNQKNQS
ncbi:recombination-associated protein RdgC [Methylocucumis oryzae]|uniref:Uncharacterized protein n=1 Tax=Methylocucumis oryzae TaxID=1632867 RepID=A0A0F3IMT6_9GAMM|nr:recombination-associated protein RdgC [Methylocucumis oryzae]KJV08002.1 hypothetical protein VZ94_00865 [Methylocucumis oryzae]